MARVFWPSLLDTPSDPLHFVFAPYVWIAGITGDVAIGRAETEVDASFTDILEGTDKIYGALGHFELGRGRWAVFFDATWMHMEVEEERGLIGEADVEFGVVSEMGVFEFGGSWTLASGVLDQDTPSTPPRAWHVDALAGGRVMLIDLELEAAADTPGPILGGEGRSRDRDQDWTEPFIGLRGGFDISENWRVQARGDIGGFGIGSDFAWQVIALVGYDFQMLGLESTFFFGYRALGEDYTDGEGTDRYAWDTVMHGPILGLAMRF